MVMTVPKMDTGSPMHTLNLGASLRDRAFRCNLRFAPISAAIPRASAPFGRCALRLPASSLRSPPRAGPTRSRPSATASPASPPRPPRDGAARRARRGTPPARPSPAAPATGCASAPPSLHFVPRRCGLRPAPASAPRCARLPAPLRAPSPPPPAACCAPLPAAPSAPPPAHAPRRLRRAALAGAVSPSLMPRDGRSRPPGGGLGSHTRRIADAGCAMTVRACDFVRYTMTVHMPARPCRAGNSCHRSVARRPV